MTNQFIPLEAENTAHNNSERVKKMMTPYRERIDTLDDALLDILVQRLQVVAEVGHFKHEHKIPIVIPERMAQVSERAAARGADKGLDPQFVRELYERIVQAGIALENDVIAKK